MYNFFKNISFCLKKTLNGSHKILWRVTCGSRVTDVMNNRQEQWSATGGPPIPPACSKIAIKLNTLYFSS